MLQETVSRISDLNVDSLVTICNEKHRFFVADQLRASEKTNHIILEPVGRNTAPAIALAAFKEIGSDPLLLVLSADHVIKDMAAFNQAVIDAMPLAEKGKLVTFGIEPLWPDVGYGYIQRGDPVEKGFEVTSFREKPDKETAESYIETGRYLWNSGMFLFKASRYLEELNTFRNDIYEACKKAASSSFEDHGFTWIKGDEFQDCPPESIDFAVMENTSEAVVFPVNPGWSDIGSWSSLWDVSDKDQAGNVTLGDSILHDTTNSYVRADDKLVAMLGVDNLVVVATKDVVMVADKNNVHEVNKVAQRLKDSSRTEWEFHREVRRPWGKYDSVQGGERHQVKLITVNPGAKLSLQKHRFRSEHWIVVSGVARATNGEDTFLMKENESTYIPAGVVHSLENPSDEILEIVEVQTGSYLGEDDIIRLEDRYGRVQQES